MLALGLVVLLSGAMFAFLWDTLGRRDELSRAAGDAQAADACLERVEADLMCATAGEPGSAGIRGTASSLVVKSRGVVVPLRSDDRARVMGDTQGTELSFEAGALRARRWSGNTEPNGGFEVVSDRVQRVRFRYYDGRAWRSSFDSAESGGLPVAVEVAVWFGPPLVSVGERTVSRPRGSEGVPETAHGEGAATVSGTDSDSAAVPTREPDRRRLIVVPDGPSSAWKEAR
jgi:hypothetical protein